MMRFASGVTDQYIYFVAVDSSDLITRETGLASFTVRRSRNGAASVAYTTPTINETDSANMPGVYELLLDEDMTIDSGDVTQAVCLHITHAGMAPVTLQYELFRPDVTAGETIGVSSGAISNVTTTATATAVTTVNGLAANTVTASALATDAVTEIQSGLSTLDAAGVRTAVGLATANLDTQLSTIDTNVDAILVDTGTDIPASIDALPTAAENADAVWDEDATAHQTQGTFGQAIGDPGLDTDTIFGLVNTNLDATVSSRASQTSVDTIDDFLDTEITAILADTNELQTDWADGGRLDLILDARASQTSVDTISTNVDAILVDTGTTLDGKIDTIDTTLDAVVADIGANGVGLTAIPWNAAWDAEVQSEVNDGLVAYDAATGTDVSGITPPTASAIADEIETRVLDANIVQVNEIAVDGSGTEADPWGP